MGRSSIGGHGRENGFMISFENTYVSGFQPAFRAMRNAMNSWKASDSFMTEDGYVIGVNDRKLAMSLVKAGASHRKHLRMIEVWVDITAPLYWIAEHDTYKVGTVRCSCSFMHKGLSRPFSIDDFNASEEIRDIVRPLEQRYILASPDTISDVAAKLRKKYDVLTGEYFSRVAMLNYLRTQYLKTQDPAIFLQIRDLLPCGHLLRYTWSANYEVLYTMYHDRKNHRLPEWRAFCRWVETLPNAYLITGEDNM